MTSREDFWKYWGKFDKGGDEGVPAWHPLACHGLDVAAAGQALLAQHHRLRRTLTEALGLEEERLREWLGFFLALHDLGKFAESFQNLRPDLLGLLQGKQSRVGYELHHDTLGDLLWQVDIKKVSILLLTGEEALRRDPLGRGLDCWASAFMGHHGRPPLNQTYPDFEIQNAFGRQDRQAALEYVQGVGRLLLSEPWMPPDREGFRQASKRFSWWLAGLVVLADWLGSNRQFFPFSARETSLEDYLRRARTMAEAAVAASGWLLEASAPLRSFAELFPTLTGKPTPLQQVAATIPLGAAPRLFILEDVTGAGKTEAAMLLVHRLLEAKQSEGLYLALPTMATANAMYERMAPFYRRLFAPDTRPSLILAHSARDLSPTFRQSLFSGVVGEPDLPKDGIPAGAHCVAWMADSRKKALLAQVGVGTIDQALLAVLHARHQSLRLLGLVGKVLVVDEVHANDDYLHQLLCSLLEFHAAAGGNVILLSATLPQGMRQALAASFAKGRASPFLQAEAYPLLTRVSAHHPGEDREEPVASGSGRWVGVDWIDAESQVLASIVTAARAGNCVCWVRNTVADARNGYRQLEKLLPGEVNLFHARFAMGDRLEIEKRVMATFGKASEPSDRRGRILVATQVVEQSLDLDFDAMISDLAPIDSLIQRAGRLRRHPRQPDGRPCQPPDQRGAATLIINGPFPENDVPANWYQAFFPHAAAVYPNHAQLWLTAQILLAKRGFSLADDARSLIEGVFGHKIGEVPDGLKLSQQRDQGAGLAAIAQARFNTVKLEEGYTLQGLDGWWGEETSPTRLGDPESTLLLARWQEGRLTPWYADRGDPRLAWAMSQVKIRQCFAKSEAVWEPRLQAAAQALPGKNRFGLLLPMVPMADGWWRGPVTDGKNHTGMLYYHPSWGLLREEERE